jgi:hypothetical protein
LEEDLAARGGHLRNLHQHKLESAERACSTRVGNRITFARAFSSWLNFGISPQFLFSLCLLRDSPTGGPTYEKVDDFFSGPFLGKHLSTVTLEGSIDVNPNKYHSFIFLSSIYTHQDPFKLPENPGVALNFVLPWTRYEFFLKETPFPAGFGKQ